MADNRPMTGAERQARYEAKAKAAGIRRVRLPRPQATRDRTRMRAMVRALEKPFIGIDGEGAGTDALGRQHYMLMHAGDRELYTGSPLTTLQCLDFICECPRDAILVGFSFGYDVTMLLRDLPGERRERVLADIEAGVGYSRYTYWDDFGVEYLAKNYLRVCRTKRVTRLDKDGVPYQSRAVIPNTSRTIYETFGFFQMSFLKSINAFQVGAEFWETIARNKAERGAFIGMTDEVRKYCAIECDLLAQMMTKFRLICYEAQLRPRTWNGAGKLSAALHESHETPTAADLETLLPNGLRIMASAAYYGGRFEVTRTGAINHPVHEYDIASAYPDAMRRLPCLLHGRWAQRPARDIERLPAESLWVAPVKFEHVHTGRPNLCGLPVRQKDGRLFWPREGRGTYWSVECEAAKLLGCRAVPNGAGWVYQKRCDCHPFDWVESLFTYRKSLGKDLRGYPLKLGINGLYGKLCQRVGTPRWGNMVWGGLITALTRAKLMQAAALDPESVVMLATDAVVSLNPLSVAIGEGLGQWEEKIHDRMFIVQPGIYWGTKKVKTRGVGASFFESKTAIFEDGWRAYAEAAQSALVPDGLAPPVVTLPLTLFIGLKLAQARGKPDTAGCWVQQQRNFSFDWHTKRSGHQWETWERVWTYPPLGGPNLQSAPHAGDKKLLEALDLEKMELDDQPDHFDMSPPD